MITRSPTHLLPLVLVLVLAAGCGPKPRPRAPSDADLRDIVEGRALQIIEEVAQETGMRLQSAWSVDVGREEPFEVDYRFADSDYGIEWVSPQDRVDWGEFLPPPNPNQLQVVPGAGEDGEVQILVVDHQSYRYDPDLERVQGGARGSREAESGVRSYVRDIITYVRGQTGG